MFHFEVEIVLICVWSETYFLRYLLCTFRFQFLFFFLFVVKKLFVVDDSADRRVSARNNFHQVETEVFGEADGFGYRQYIRLNVFSHNPYAGRGDFIVDFVLALFSVPVRNKYRTLVWRSHRSWWAWRAVKCCY